MCMLPGQLLIVLPSTAPTPFEFKLLFQILHSVDPERFKSSRDGWRVLGSQTRPNEWTAA